ncbi:MAG TPA: T9SS type A sorting domain-containing protein [Bacteroidia bacterium]|nr:T9SS type A sorting domain-containing protein [Bacteroidia bacterium]
MKKQFFLFPFFVMILSALNAQVITPPYFNNFESGASGWAADTTTTNLWQLGLPNFGTTTVAFSGVNAWSFDSDSTNSEAILYSPVFDFSTTIDATLSFWLSFDTEQNWDGTRLEYNKNNTGWTLLSNGATSFNWYNMSAINCSGQPAWAGSSAYLQNPTAAGWAYAENKLNALNGLGPNDVQFRFVFCSDASVISTGVSIDDFSIHVPQPDDAGIYNIIRPYSSSAAGYSSPVSFEIKNYGSNNLSSFDVSYSLDGGAPVTQTWNGTLLPGAIDTVVFPNITVPTGSYSICAYTSLAGDPNNTNDTLCVQRTGVIPFIDITNYPDTSSYSPCDIPYQYNDFIYGTTFGLNFGDTILIHAAWGDGTDDTYILPGNGSITLQVTHSYTFPGQFSIQYVATALGGGLSDTITMYNQVILSDSCEVISGTVYFDSNANCMFDAGDTKLYSIPVELQTGGGTFLWDFTDINGDYNFNVPIGLTYDIILTPANNLYTPTCPASGIYPNISVLPSTGNDFAVDATPGYDLQPTVFTWNVRPNFNSTVNLTMRNNLLLPVMGELRFPVDTNSFNYVSAVPVPSSISGDTLIWNSGLLSYNSGNFNADVVLFAKPGLQIGETVCLSAIAEPIFSDSVPSNNIASICRVVTNSADPNDKNVTPSGPIQSTDNLTYHINFQNTGNDVAYNIFVLDTLDPSLDISTMQLIASSHSMSTIFLNSHVIKFTFNNINLPDSNANEPASHGYISYSIRPVQGLINGTVINNNAGIYFDFNPAVMTNTTYNVIDNPVGISAPLPENESFIIYPNPAHDVLSIAAKNNSPLGNIILNDLMGKEILNRHVSENRMLLNVKNISNGMYFISIEENGNKLKKKIIILH